MKEDLFKKMGNSAEKELLSMKALNKVKGGTSHSTFLTTNQYLNCGLLQANSLGSCPGNLCDPFNWGACPGNTVLGGPRSCPL